MLLISILLSACRGGTPTDAGEGTHEYVGEIPGTEFFAAIAVGPAGEVLAYVCNGMGVDFLFRGVLQSDKSLALNSESGNATLQANAVSEGFSATFSVDGGSHSFTVTPAMDYGGLYRVTGLSETEAEGYSQAGSFLELTLLPDKSGLHVEVTTPDGVLLTSDRHWLEGHDHSKPTEYLEHWVILLHDGRGRGGKILSSFTKSYTPVDPICIP
jgi:hypothetical protein